MMDGQWNIENSIYVSGGITKVPNYKEMFATAVAKLKDKGYLSVCIYNPSLLDLGPDASWQDYMRPCISALMECDSIYMLKEWYKSEGALEEHRLAKRLGFKIFYEEEEDV